MKQFITAFILWAFITLIVGMGAKIYFDGRCDVQIAPEMIHK